MVLTEKKNVQCETCVLSFIWDKMKTTAQETVFQTALRNGSTETLQGGQYVCDFSEGGTCIKHVVWQKVAARH